MSITPKFETSKIPIEVLYRESRKEIGQLNSYVIELEYTIKQKDDEINRLKKLTDIERKEVKLNSYYQEQNKKIRVLELKVRDYKKDIDKYLTELLKNKI